MLTITEIGYLRLEGNSISLTLNRLHHNAFAAVDLAGELTALTHPLDGLETRSSATAKSTARPSCLVGVLYDIYRVTNNRSTANEPLVRNWP